MLIGVGAGSSSGMAVLLLPPPQLLKSNRIGSKSVVFFIAPPGPAVPGIDRPGLSGQPLREVRYPLDQYLANGCFATAAVSSRPGQGDNRDRINVKWAQSTFFARPPGRENKYSEPIFPDLPNLRTTYHSSALAQATT